MSLGNKFLTAFNISYMNYKRFKTSSVLFDANDTLSVYTHDPQVAFGSGNYYFAGVVFMIAVIILLLYVNLYYDNCLTETFEDISKFPMCSCIKIFLVYESEIDQETRVQVKNFSDESPQQMSDIPHLV